MPSAKERLAPERLEEERAEVRHGRTIARVAGLLQKASPDELKVVEFVASRIMGIGRKQYGALDLSTDKRDFGRELDEELADVLVYVACARLQGSGKDTA